jgi:DNA invertase Pin-like site-specific DNA recombinase
MSTDMQQYSIENQAAAIRQYAASHGLTVVQSYQDAGRSGLKLKGRPALKQLILDVVEGRANFETVLIYDVSRWGRFQDNDESAHYEFLCRQAGVTVEYCAEQFSNDGSVASTVLKNMKRAMAAEYSRELSVKVHAGICRVAAQGFHAGAQPGYGLRRFLLDAQGCRKMELASGQHKNVKTERVTLAPGPPDEVAIVHLVYARFIDEKSSLNAIARELNQIGARRASGLQWRATSVRDLLCNEKYRGNCLYNRISKKLGTKARRNPTTDWIRSIGAFEPMVTPDRFAKAQQRLKERWYTDNELLDFLTALWCREKRLSREVIDDSPGTPGSSTYRVHFGTVMNAYRRVGYSNPLIADRRKLRQLRKTIIHEISAQIVRLGGTVEVHSGPSAQLRVNDEFNLTVLLGRTSPSSAVSKQNEWRFFYQCARKPDFLLVVRVDNDGLSPLDYYLLPSIFLPAGRQLTASGINYRHIDDFRIQSLEPLYKLSARVPVRSLAA